MFEDNFYEIMKPVLLLCFTIFIFSFAPRLIDSLHLLYGSECEEYVVDAVVVDSYYAPSYTTVIPTGKTAVPVHHSARYEIVVMYEDETYRLSDEELYYKYKDSIGETVSVLLQVETYGDGDVSLNIKEVF